MQRRIGPPRGQSCVISSREAAEGITIVSATQMTSRGRRTRVRGDKGGAWKTQGEGRGGKAGAPGGRDEDGGGGGVLMRARHHRRTRTGGCWRWGPSRGAWRAGRSRAQAGQRPRAPPRRGAPPGKEGRYRAGVREAGRRLSLGL